MEKESWWMMTEAMAKRAAHYGIFNDVEKFAKDNGLFNFALNLVRGKDMAKLISTTYTARKAANASPLQKELYAAQILEENGHTVYFTPENKTVKKMKNYDAIIDGRLGEFKKLESFGQLQARLNDADKKQAVIVYLEVPEKDITLYQAEKAVINWFKNSQRKINYVEQVLLIWGKRVIAIKK